MNTILVVEDDATLRGNIAELLTEEGFRVIVAGSATDGIALARARMPSLIICDIMLPGEDGHAVLQTVRTDPQLNACPFIFLTARSERADVRAGMDLGADDYVTKPFSLKELVLAVRARLARVESIRARSDEAAEREHVQRAHLPLGVVAGDGVVVSDPRMQALYGEAQQVAGGLLSVLLLGETGVGKEIFARAIHDLSPRRSGPFLAINCGALNEDLLEAELFGHERGAFTGAFQARMGLFESASGGTLFLDELGELPMTMQSRLLRVLDERRVLRVGGRSPTEIDVRFISATNRDIEAETASGRFRQDLYYRVCGTSFTLPPLRQRKAEILDLARLFAARACAAQGRAPVQMAPSTARLLEEHAWPGNVRELRNAIERALAFCRSDMLLPEHLPAWASSRTHHAVAPLGVPPVGVAPLDVASPAVSPASPREEERQRIQTALAQNLTQTDAAKSLGVSRRKLVYRMKELDIPGPRKRPQE